MLLCERFGEALDILKTGQWAKAADRLEAILRDYPEDGPARFHLARCQRYQAGSSASDFPYIVSMDSK